MEELLGKVVSGLRVSDDQHILAFDHPGGTYTAYRTTQDCCSETWFADILGVAFLLGGTVCDVSKKELPSSDNGRGQCSHSLSRRNQGFEQFYGVTLRTNKGYADIIYRNSSNGYYGGDIMTFSGTLPGNMVRIVADWQAEAPA